MIRTALTSFIILFMVASGSAQFEPNLEFGSIVSLLYIDSQDEVSPLSVNQGSGTFGATWTVLLGMDINEQLAFYGEAQTRTGLEFVTYGLSAIYRPTRSGVVNVEFGKFLAPFGNFLGRRWAPENPLTAWPLLYDYRSALSAFDVPESAAELLLARGHGQKLSYGVTISRPESQLARASQSVSSPGQGLRILSRQVYLTGAQVFGTYKKLSYNLGLTNGALSNPVTINNSAGVQLVARVTLEPTWGLVLGSSFASGAYLDKGALSERLRLANRRVQDFRQTTVAFDLSYSIGHLEFFGELLHNRWQTPFLDENLDALASEVELKYSFLTRFYLAGRWSRIDFGEIADAQDVDGDGRRQESWDFDVDQVEVGVGYHFNRNGLFKLIRVFNQTHEVPGGDPEDDRWTAEMVVSF